MQSDLIITKYCNTYGYGLGDKQNHSSQVLTDPILCNYVLSKFFYN